MLPRRLSFALVCAVGFALGLAVLWSRSEYQPGHRGVLLEVPGRRAVGMAGITYKIPGGRCSRAAGFVPST